MSGHVRMLPRPVVRIGGIEVPRILSVRTVFGLDIRVSEAYVTVPTMPAWIREWDPVQIVMGPDASHLYGRFCGYYLHNRRSLYPLGVELVCYGPLVRARNTENETEGGTDMSNYPTGRTDQAMVTLALQSGGLTDAELMRVGMGPLYIEGTGETLGTVAYEEDELGNPIGPFTVRQGESWLAFIERLEEVTLGYRTYEAPSGYIVRARALVVPAPTAAHSFTEGVDIFTADLDEEVLEIKNKVVVTGYDIGDGGGAFADTQSQASPYLVNPDGTPRYNTLDVASGMIEKSLPGDAGEGISAREVALWRLGEHNRKTRRLRKRTPSGEILFPGQTVQVAAPTRLGLTDRYVIQHVEATLDQDGWTQDLTLLGGVGSTAPTARPPMADFTMICEIESVIVAGVEAVRYLIHCRSTSIGMASAIASHAWSETDGATGAEQTFTVVYESPATKEITLEVTDANGQTASVTKGPPATTDPTWVYRRLYAAGTHYAECLLPGGWNVDAPSGAQDVEVVGDGPIWGAGEVAMYSDDGLVTSADESTPHAGASPTHFFTETDLDGDRILAGRSDGGLSYSADGGATWTDHEGPDGQPVLKVAISRENSAWWYVLTAVGLYLTMDAGAGYATLLEADYTETFKDMAVGHTRTMVVMVGGRVAVDSQGNAQSFPGGIAGFVAVAPDIVEDRFVAYDADGHTYRTTTDGGTAFAAREDLPAGLVVQERGLARDGAVRDLYYIAGGTGGCWKSVDGFASAGGYFQIRSPGVGNSPADADYAMIGADGLLSAGGISATVVSDAESLVLSLWNGSGNDGLPSGVEQPDYDDSAWNAATEQGDSAQIAGAKDIWGSSVQSATEECVFRRTFALGTGVPTSVSLEITADDVVVNAWLNGTWIGSKATAQGTVATWTIPPALLIPGADNVLVLHVRNTDA